MQVGASEQAVHRYPLISQLLHWVIAGLIIVQFVLANLAESAEDSGATLRQLALLANHKSVGMTILLLAVLRLLWRIGHPPPPLPAAMPLWQLRASQASHWALYGLLFLLPISGWLMSSASAYSVSWFNLFQFPDLLASDPELKEVFAEIHETLVLVLVCVAVLHIAAALKHHFMDRDSVLVRISSRLTIGTGICLALLGSLWLGGSGRSDNTTESVPARVGQQAAGSQTQVVRASSLPLWQIDYKNSFIRFTGSQAGASFTGSWESWAADIRFDRDAPAEGSFDVKVQTADVITGDSERDATLADTDWFDTQSYPTAHYQAERFTPQADGSYIAEGTLTIKGFAAPVQLYFTIEESDGQRILEGRASVLRLALGVGTGEWADTSWVSNEVSVSVRVQAALGSAIP